MVNEEFESEGCLDGIRLNSGGSRLGDISLCEFILGVYGVCKYKGWSSLTFGAGSTFEDRDISGDNPKLSQ